MKLWKIRLIIIFIAGIRLPHAVAAAIVCSLGEKTNANKFPYQPSLRKAYCWHTKAHKKKRTSASTCREKRPIKRCTMHAKDGVDLN